MLLSLLACQIETGVNLEPDTNDAVGSLVVTPNPLDLSAPLGEAATGSLCWRTSATPR